MRISIPIFTAVLLLPGLVPSLYSQEQLQTLSIDFDRQYRIERAEAESAAVADGYPIKLIKPDGSTIELQRLNNGRPVYYKTDNVIAGKTIPQPVMVSMPPIVLNAPTQEKIRRLWAA